MSTPPLVSVTICVYNGERYLRGTLNSVFSQTYSNFEVVAVDDGSTDLSRQILTEYAFSHDNMRVVFQTNEGLAAARNRSFVEARGELIAIIDQDDLCYPNRLERQVETAARHPDAGIVFCNTHYIDEHGTIRGDHLSNFRIPPDRIPAVEAGNLLLREGCFIDSEAVLLRKAVLNRVGYLDESLHYACDYEFFVRVGIQFPLGYSSDVLGAWRVHSGQATQTNLRRYIELRQVYIGFMRKREINLRTKLKLVVLASKAFIRDVLIRKIRR
jgi:glycosyltransferase involved in cell wall biosynthesis